MAKKNLAPLVILAQKGDRDALNELLSQCYETLFYYAYNTVKNEDLAGDITQESCMEIMQTIGNLRNPEAFMTWAGRIVAHQCTRHYRQAPDEVLLEENEDGETILDRLPDESRGSLPEQVQEDKEFRQTMWQMLDSLPAEQRQALLLYYYENLSVGEIAQIQGKSEGTVKSRLNYGRKAVMEQVNDYEKKTGVRLHSLTPLPLLLWFLFRENMAEVLSNAAGVLRNVSAIVSGAVGAAGVAAGATAAGGAAAGSAAAGATAAGGAAAGSAAAGTAVAVKIAAGVIAATLAVGAVAGGVMLSQKDSGVEEIAGEWIRIPVDLEERKILQQTESMVISKDGTMEYEGKTYNLRVVDDMEDGERTKELAATPAGEKTPKTQKLQPEDVYYIRYEFEDEGGIVYLGTVYSNDVGEMYSDISTSFYRESDYQNYTPVVLTEANIADYVAIYADKTGALESESREPLGAWTGISLYFKSFNDMGYKNAGAASYCILTPELELELIDQVIMIDPDSGEYGLFMQEFTNPRTERVAFDQTVVCGRVGLFGMVNAFEYEYYCQPEDWNSGEAFVQTAEDGRLIGAKDVMGVIFVPNLDN